MSALIPAASLHAAFSYSNLTPVFEISGFPGNGEFADVSAFSIDEREGTVSIIAGPPLSVFVSGLSTGAPMRSSKIEQKIGGRPAYWKCGDYANLLSSEGYFAYAADGKIIEDATLPDGFATSSVKVICAPGGGTVSLDATSMTVSRYDAKGKPTFTVPDKDTAAKCCGKNARTPLRVGDFAPDPSGGVYALDAKYTRVVQFDYNGRFRKIVVGEKREADAPDLVSPALIASDRRGNIFIYDAGDRTIKVYDDFGYLKRVLMDTLQNGGFAFNRPIDMQIDRNGRLFILDSWTHSLKAFDISGIN